MKKVVVTVSGAAGQISYALLFRLLSGAVFGPGTEIDLRLLEIPSALKHLEGLVMELEDCSFPLLHSVSMTTDLKAAFQGANWVVLLGSFPRQAGMERKDLLKKNADIFAVQGRALNEWAASDVRIFVVGNPCNTNCWIAMRHAPDIPQNRFYAMTRLDQNRARFQLAKKAQVEVRLVSNMIIWGNHSSTQYPDFYHATINDQSATDVIADDDWLKNTFIPLIQQRGAAVIQARGASSAASAANAVIDSLADLAGDTQTTYSLAMCSTGEYGVNDGVIFSFPCRTVNGLPKIVEGIQHSEFSQKKLALSLQELREEQNAVEALGLA